MNSTSKWLVIVAAAFVAGSFVASPELRAFAANTVGSSDIINESILSADIKNGEVKASDIGADSVGGSELIGVSKLLFGQCRTTSAESNVNIPGGLGLGIDCTIGGVAIGDSVLAVKNSGGNSCFKLEHIRAEDGHVALTLQNTCPQTAKPGQTEISIIVFDK